MRDYDQHEIDLKQKLARYPWINEEMGERKTECCKRLHYDALRRLGLPLPEWDHEPTTAELLDAKFECPSIYQSIQQGAHAPLGAFASTEEQFRKNNLNQMLSKYKDFRVPQDKLRYVDEVFFEEDDLLGDLPVLMIDLLKDKVIKENTNL